MTNQETNSNHKYDPKDLLEQLKKDMKQASSPEEQLLLFTRHKEIEDRVVKYA